MDFRAAADVLAENRLNPHALDRLGEHLRPETEEEAYALQPLVHHRLEERGLGPRVGYKIGCTTAVMQAFLNIPEPCAGGIMANTVHHGGADLRYASFVRVGVECEIAVRLSTDLVATETPYTRNNVGGAIECCMAAAEVVDDRYVDFHTMGTPSLIADDFFGAGCVLGEPVTDWRTLDLRAIEGRTVLNGQEVGRGTGDAVLGHPLEAVAWLANMTCATGGSLKAGEIILTGSLVETKWLEGAGDKVMVLVDGLGSVEINLS